jgi:circadian clock protein KaiC
MFGGKGYYRGSSVLISGTAGTGKSSLAAAFADSVCRRGDRCLYFSFEESPEQIARNMASIGIDLVNWVDKGLLRFVAKRPTQFGLEAHLVGLHVAVTDFKPVAVVMDPITSMSSIGETEQIKAPC